MTQMSEESKHGPLKKTFGIQTSGNNASTKKVPQHRTMKGTNGVLLAVTTWK